MTGRRRRVPSESSASDDSNNIKCISDKDFLRPHAEGQDPDKWPIFEMTDFAVYRLDAYRRLVLANPTLSETEGPFVLRGRVHVEEEQTMLLIKPRGPRSAFIQVGEAASYSIGWDPCSVWISGPCGWFRVRQPIKTYRPLFNKVLQGVTLYYKIVGIYEQALEAPNGKGRRKKNASLPPAYHDMDYLLFQYALSVGDGVLREEAQDRLKYHRDFLISHCSLSQEDSFSWTQTPFYHWLYHKFPDSVAKLRAARVRLSHSGDSSSRTVAVPEYMPPSAGILTSKQRDSPAEASRSTRSSENADVDMPDLSDLVLRGRRKPSTEATKPAPAPKSQGQLASDVDPQPNRHSAKAEAEALERLVEVLEVIRSQWDGHKRLKTGYVKSQIWLKCKVGSEYTSAYRLLSHFSPQLVNRLGRDWHATEFFRDLREMAKQPDPLADFTDEDMVSKLVRRKEKGPAQPAQPPQPSAATTRGSFDTPTPPAATPPAAQSGGGSRPKRGRPSGKSAVLRLAGSKRPAAEMDEEANEKVDIEDDDYDWSAWNIIPAVPGPTRRRGRPPLAQAQGQQQQQPGQARRQRGRPRKNQPEAADASGSSNSGIGSVDVSDNDLLPTGSDKGVRLVVRAQPLVPPGGGPGGGAWSVGEAAGIVSSKMAVPTGPNGAWVCAACGLVIRSAGEDDLEQRSQVQAHIRSHQFGKPGEDEDDDDEEDEEAIEERVSLAVSEGLAGHTAVEHLLEKIRSIGERTRRNEEIRVNDQLLPAPIKKRLLV